jgi:hypothetical protein
MQQGQQLLLFEDEFHETGNGKRDITDFGKIREQFACSEEAKELARPHQCQ